MRSFLSPRSSRSRCMRPASRARNQTRLPAASSTYRSTSSGRPSGQVSVIRNSALGSTAPVLAIGLISRNARTNITTKPSSALNSRSVKPNPIPLRRRIVLPPFGRGQGLAAFERRQDENLGEPGGTADQLLDPAIQQKSLHLQEHAADQTGQRGVQRDRHAAAHRSERALDGA